MIAVQIDPESLRPLIDAAVAVAIARMEAGRAALDGRMAYSEPEAADLLGLKTHQLRDERLRGRISASMGPGRKILYSRDNLARYLAGRPWTPRE
jgi:hypothetical protein